MRITASIFFISAPLFLLLAWGFAPRNSASEQGPMRCFCVRAAEGYDPGFLPKKLLAAPHCQISRSALQYIDLFYQRRTPGPQDRPPALQAVRPAGSKTAAARRQIEPHAFSGGINE